MKRAAKKNTQQPGKGRTARIVAWLADNWLTVYIIAMGASGSFIHFIHLAEKNGQTGYEAVTSSLIFDAVAIFFQQEIQKDKRDGVRGWRRCPPLIGMLTALTFTVAANYQTAFPGFWGTTFGIAPPIVLMVIITFRERRVSLLTRKREQDPTAADSPAKAGSGAGSGTSPRTAGTGTGTGDQNQGGTGGDADENQTFGETAEGDGPGWLPDRIDRSGVQDTEVLYTKILDAMAEYARRAGRPLNGAQLGKILTCSKQDALRLRAAAEAWQQQQEAAS